MTRSTPSRPKASTNPGPKRRPRPATPAGQGAQTQAQAPLKAPKSPAKEAAKQAELDAARPEVKVIMQVHDELVFELPAAEQDWVRTEIPRLMAQVAELKVPLLAEVGFGPNWDQAH